MQILICSINFTQLNNFKTKEKSLKLYLIICKCYLLSVLLFLIRINSPHQKVFQLSFHQHSATTTKLLPFLILFIMQIKLTIANLILIFSVKKLLGGRKRSRIGKDKIPMLRIDRSNFRFSPKKLK